MPVIAIPIKQTPTLSRPRGVARTFPYGAAANARVGQRPRAPRGAGTTEFAPMSTNSVVRARIDETTRQEAAVVLDARGRTLSDTFRLLC
jgi:hypothetical protein